MLGAVERAHVTALRNALGAAAVARPTFDFRGTTEDEDAFIKTAVAFNDLGTAATRARPSTRDACAARGGDFDRFRRGPHVAWIRYLAEAPPASSAFDEPRRWPRRTPRRLHGLHRRDAQHAIAGESAIHRLTRRRAHVVAMVGLVGVVGVALALGGGARGAVPRCGRRPWRQPCRRAIRSDHHLVSGSPFRRLGS